MAIGLAVVGIPIAYFLNIWIAGFLIFVGLIAFAGYVGNLERMVTVRRGQKKRIKAAIIIGGLVIEILLLYPRWQKEKAAALEGEIRPSNPVRLHSPAIQLADTGAILQGFTMVPLKIFSDAEIAASLSNDGATEISTTVLDRYGRRIVEVKKNHWRVEPSASVDKNYTDDALEVLDSGGHVVLQLRALPDRMVLWGEWHNEFEQAAQITACPDPSNTNAKIACVQIYGPALPEKTSKKHIEQLFQYPSSEHWGEYRKTK